MSIIKNATTHMSRLALATGTAAALAFAPVALADDTVALKNALYGAGYGITNVNPTMDDATRAQLTRFQKDNGLQATGTLDDESKEALGISRVQVAASSSASQPAADKPSQPVEEVKEVEEEDDGGWSFF